jgi:hypothetical protein
MDHLLDVLPVPDDVTKSQMELVEKEKLEYKLLGSCILTPGLSLFSFNVETGEIRKITVERKKSSFISAHNNKLTSVDNTQRTVKIDTKLIYFEALNIKTAVKRVSKAIQGKIKLFNLRLVKNEKINSNTASHDSSL